ncbi:aldehyde dehydrogenase (NAD+) [Rhodococcus rhodochrous J45]|uniref:aldehyde dehydrogenase (NAD(+)) n=1 Tax=Rhodococcus rhodochrous J45 TaxID=935266 RepID=A0A562DIN3_RHORH|nr:aldehyde dehydrogenase family protein [Rhodococcus rhodochrous]TWH09456.1 aldehyde dehydrogenase (NAD+) [Rhodococcus rhodochrous J45]
MIRRNQIYVNGNWVDSTADSFLEVVNPATEEVIAEVARGTAEDVDVAVSAATAAFDGWSQSSVDDRVTVLRALADVIESNGEEVTNTILAEIGQPVTWAQKASTEMTVRDLRNFADALPEVLWEEKIGNASVYRLPAGVVGAITAWNGPIRSVCLKAGAAIAAGCTVVLKSSEVAPLTPFLLAGYTEKAGLPAGVFNIVTGTGPEVGEAIVTHPGVDMVSLTGSVRAGSRVMELAAQSVKRVALELGGKSANVILPGADLERAVTVGVQDAFRNSGQACGALTRFLVPRDQLEEAEALAAATADSFVVGDPTDPATHLGPLANADQYRRVRSHIERAIGEGVKLVAGGLERPDGLDKGFYVRPTIFSGTNKDRIAREEVFGPVVVIIPFDGEDDAVRIANDTDYGLAGGVWAADAEHARTVARRLRTGRVRINGTPLDMRAPHGGLKLSGIGREMGRHGIEDYLEYQALHG